MAWIFIKESVSEKKSFSFDWWGAMALGVALSSVVLVLDKGSDWGFLSMNAFWSYFTAIFFFLIFIWIEMRVKEPIIDLKFFKNSIFIHTLVNNFIVFISAFGRPESVYATTGRPSPFSAIFLSFSGFVLFASINP